MVKIIKLSCFLFFILGSCISEKQTENKAVKSQNTNTAVNTPSLKLANNNKPLKNFSELNALTFENYNTNVWVELLHTSRVRRASLNNGAIDVKGKELFIGGQACDMPNGVSHKEIYILLNGKLFSTESQKPSPAIAEKFNNDKFDKCNFLKKIPLRGIKSGVYPIEVIVVTNENTYYRIDKMYDPIGHLPDGKLNVRII